MSARRNPLAPLIERLFERLADILIARMSDKLLHPRTLLLRKAQKEAVAFVEEHMASALILNTGHDVLRLSLARAPEDGMILEFGVAGGASINVLAKGTTRHIHGFDSFEGLPEDWGGRHEEKGHYSTGGVLPETPANVTLHKGWFDDTLPGFFEKNDGPVAFAHIDCDLYASTKTALEHIAPRLKPGSIIVFDEFFNIPNWQQNEFRAFREFVSTYKVGVSYICWAYQQVAVRIDRIDNDPPEALTISLS